MYLSLQGNLGLSKAIDYFTSHNIVVSIPLNDTQKYDLVAEFNGKLQRVSVKTSRNLSTSGAYSVQLRNTGGASGKSKITFFNKETCDYLFIYTGNNDIYLIPSEIINCVNAISVGNKYIEYKVKIKPFSEWINDLEG